MVYLMKKLPKILKKIIDDYKKNLQLKFDKRSTEMSFDVNNHYMIYKVLGISKEKGKMIDLYQNFGRFLYKDLGALIQKTVTECIINAHPNAKPSVKIKNTASLKPKTFEIDCLVNKDAFEIKWKDATTDGDHIEKEHKRIKVIANEGFIPIRLMFFLPEREQAKKIQKKLESVYETEGGQYYSGDKAWSFLKKYTLFDLKSFFEKYN